MWLSRAADHSHFMDGLATQSCDDMRCREHPMLTNFALSQPSPRKEAARSACANSRMFFNNRGYYGAFLVHALQLAADHSTPMVIQKHRC